MSVNIESRKKESFKIFDQIASTYDYLNRILSMGIDIYWRKCLVKFLPHKFNLEVIDLATGTGDVALVLGKLKNVKKVTGIDLSKEMVSIARKKVAQKKLNNKIDLIIGDAVTIPIENNSCDAVTVSFGIRNFNDPLKSLQNMHRILRKNGRALIMEFSIPRNKIVKAVYLFYFRNILPLIGNLFSNHGDAYTYLNQTVEDFPHGEQMKDLILEAGFQKVHYKTLTFGIATIYCGLKDE